MRIRLVLIDVVTERVQTALSPSPFASSPIAILQPATYSPPLRCAASRHNYQATASMAARIWSASQTYRKNAVVNNSCYVVRC